MKWVEQAGPGEIRLPRPQDADRARDGGEARRAARHRHRPVRASRSTTPRPTRCWRAARPSGCSRWKARACARPCVDMRPDRFEDLIALVALYRPGPMANIPTYCARKHGREAVDYLHPRLEPILRADLRHHHLSGAGACRSPATSPATRWPRPTCCAAPWARRSRPRWRRSAAVSRRRGRARDRQGDRPTTIFDACAKFAEYGFNKSHSAAYALHHLSDRLSEGELSRSSSWPHR